MSKPNRAIRVMFRKDRKKPRGVYALLPYDIADHEGNVTVYDVHCGHGAGDRDHCIRTSTPAKPDEYADTLAMMVNAGYDNLKIIKRPSWRYNWDRFL